MIRFIRKFSEFQKFSLDSDRVIPKSVPNEPKETLGFKEKASKMKAVFGEEYKSPYEKYDIQVPRTSIYDGPESMETRLNEKTKFKRITNLYKFLFSLFILGTGSFFYSLSKSARKAEEAKQELIKNAMAKQLIFEKYSKIYEERKKNIENLKD